MIQPEFDFAKKIAQQAAAQQAENVMRGNSYSHIPEVIGKGEFYMQRATLYSTLTNIFDTVSDRMKEIETPTSYEEQVKRSRQIWPIYGSSAKYADPIVAPIMDLMVSTTVAFGAETIFKAIPLDAEQKKVVDHFCANVNAGKPMLTQGLDAIRKQWHMMRWCDGGVVEAWDKETTMTTDDGISYKAPAGIALYPRDKFDVQTSQEFGGFKLAWKGTLLPSSGIPGEEISIDELPPQMDFLSQNRYKVCDRRRIESSQMYPVPYLVARGITSACARIRAMQRGDFQTVLRVLRAILLLTHGSDAWLEYGLVPTEMEWTNAKAQLTESDTPEAVVMTGDHTADAKWIQPDMAAMMSNAKFIHDDMERLAGLGIIEIVGTGQRRRYAYNPKPLIMEIWDAMQEDRRLIENVIFPLLWKHNPGIFRGISPANFHQKPITIFMEPEAMQHIMTLFQMGAQSYGDVIENVIGFGADAAAVLNRRKYEKEQGYEDTLTVRPQFSQTVVNPGSDTHRPEDEEDEETEEALQAAPNAMDSDYAALKARVKDISSSSASNNDKKRAIHAAIVATMLAMSIDLQARLRRYYSDQFAGDTLGLNLFEAYIEKAGSFVEKLGADIYGGNKNGTPGLDSMFDAANIDAHINRVFSANQYRLGLLGEEPFRVAAIAAGAASAAAGGMSYAVRHCAFYPTTCEECIELHGTVVSINSVFKGEFDHPHGLCSFTYHESESAAEEETENMLSIQEINALCAAADAEIEKIIGS